MNGTEKERGETEHYAREWERYGNFRFDFKRVRKTGNDLAIVVKFKNIRGGLGGISCVGCGERSLKYSSLTLKRNPSRGIILHEFGHSLGLEHEHVNPTGTRAWNHEEAYKYFQRLHGWTRKETKRYLFEAKADPKRYAWGDYDPHSVMHYTYPGYLFKNRQPAGGSQDLSSKDIRGIRNLYPGRPHPGYRPSTLLYFGRGRKTLILKVKNARGIVYVNGQKALELDSRNPASSRERRFGIQKEIDISSHMNLRRRTKISLHFLRNAANSKSSGAYLNIHERHGGKKSLVGSLSLFRIGRISHSDKELKKEYYFTHFENRNRGRTISSPGI